MYQVKRGQYLYINFKDKFWYLYYGGLHRTLTCTLLRLKQRCELNVTVSVACTLSNFLKTLQCVKCGYSKFQLVMVSSFALDSTVDEKN